MDKTKRFVREVLLLGSEGEINLDLYLQALTHSSYVHEQPELNQMHNERLEFLGDAVLDLIVSERIFLLYPHLPEGKLSRIRAGVVCSSCLADRAKLIDLGSYLRLGKGEEASGGREKDTLLADAFEALIGAIYLDKGLKSVEAFVMPLLEEGIIAAESGSYLDDFKSALQERFQKERGLVPRYSVLSEEGPDHSKIFTVGVFVDSEILGQGKGRSKKEAEQRAAQSAWQDITE